MTTFDVCVLIVLSLSFLYSLFKGFIREVFALLAYAGGYVTAVKFHEDFAKSLAGTISSDTVAKVAAFIIIFVSTMIAVKIFGNIIKKMFHEGAGLSGTDRMLGGMVGLAKGVVILVMLMVPLGYFPDFQKKAVADSFFAPHLQAVSGTVKETLGASREFIENMPGMDKEAFKGLSEKIRGLEEILKMSKNNSAENGEATGNVDIEKTTQMLKELQNASKFLGKPQEEYTDEDVRQLDELLKKVSKDQTNH